jgi:hypothetical protein
MLELKTVTNVLLQMLEHEKVIECVKRGKPNKPGFRGRATL